MLPSSRDEKPGTDPSGQVWLVWAGCQWRALTRAWQIPWQSVYYYFRKWKNNAFPETKTLGEGFEQLKDELLMARRLQEERNASSSAIAVDSQTCPDESVPGFSSRDDGSVKITSFVSEDTGIDGNKRLKGRKRHLAVDALGYPIALYVTGADVSDTEAGKTLADRLAAKLQHWSDHYGSPTRLALVRADGGYKTTFIDPCHPNLQVGSGYSTKTRIDQGLCATSGPLASGILLRAFLSRRQLRVAQFPASTEPRL